MNEKKVREIANVNDLFKDIAKEERNNLPISKVTPNPDQPRIYFDPEKLDSLISSIKKQGILQPLVVRPIEKGMYQIVAGERRYRAAKHLGFNSVPVVIKTLTDEETQEIALVENIQRSDLNPIETVNGVLAVIKLKTGLEKKEVKKILNRASKQNQTPNIDVRSKADYELIEGILEIVGVKPQSFRVHYLPLLEIPEDVKGAVINNGLELTKAKLIAKLPRERLRKKVINDTLNKKLSVREIKEAIAKINQGKGTKNNTRKKAPKMLDSTYKKLKESAVWGDPEKEKIILDLLEEISQVIQD